MSECTSNVQTKALRVITSGSGARDLLTLWVSLHFKKLYNEHDLIHSVIS